MTRLFQLLTYIVGIKYVGITCFMKYLFLLMTNFNPLNLHKIITVDMSSFLKMTQEFQNKLYKVDYVYYTYSVI